VEDAADYHNMPYFIGTIHQYSIVIEIFIRTVRNNSASRIDPRELP